MWDTCAMAGLYKCQRRLLSKTYLTMTMKRSLCRSGFRLVFSRLVSGRFMFHCFVPYVSNASFIFQLHERPLLTKFYKNGNICLILFSDGTGNVFYKNGGVAISITLASRGMHVFTAFSEHEFNPVLLAMFDPYGNGYCNYLTGKLRFVLYIL